MQSADFQRNGFLQLHEGQRNHRWLDVTADREDSARMTVKVGLYLWRPNPLWYVLIHQYQSTSVSINISKGKWLKQKSYWLSISLVHISYVLHNIISNNCLFLQNNRLFPENLLHHNSSLIYHAPFWRLNLYTLILIVNSKHFFNGKPWFKG